MNVSNVKTVVFIIPNKKTVNTSERKGLTAHLSTQQVQEEAEISMKSSSAYTPFFQKIIHALNTHLVKDDSGTEKE